MAVDVRVTLLLFLQLEGHSALKRQKKGQGGGSQCTCIRFMSFLTWGQEDFFSAYVMSDIFSEQKQRFFDCLRKDNERISREAAIR